MSSCNSLKMLVLNCLGSDNRATMNLVEIYWALLEY